ncbi:hypothetical protein LIER_32330 [Lithospermum erythrorhizon]|uniref:DUF4371 domain-containing protein n=1 Tax=Lithospermum erythrorhizon TaxID=34254 RepID=A0AAV3RXJ9_LITER
MTVCVRYVDSIGSVVKRFLGIAHVKDTSAASLKQTLLDLLTPFKLSVSKIRGQGYDGASNMSGRLSGLRTLIQNENPYAFYVHCFAHQLQLALVAAMALQRCDQDLLNALNLIKIAKIRLQRMRDDGWDVLITKVVEIGKNHDIEVPDMSGPYYLFKSRRQASTTSNLHHYKNDCFLNILDVQMKELNKRFDVENTELLHCVACLSPFFKFMAFDVDKLMRMTELYPTDFLDEVESSLHNQLDNYIEDVRDVARFQELKGIGDL